MATFRPDRHAIGQILVSEEIRAVLDAKAEQAKGIAETIAPYDPADLDGQHYRDYFYTSSGTQMRKTTRAFAALENDHPAAVPIEFGTKDTPAHHTLLRAVEAMKE